MLNLFNKNKVYQYQITPSLSVPTKGPTIFSFIFELNISMLMKTKRKKMKKKNKIIWL